jgi:PAS domain S-box-containing protein
MCALPIGRGTLNSAYPEPTNFDPAKDVLEKLFEYCPDALLISEPDGRILQCNAQLEAMFGHTQSELIGQRVEILLPERFRDTHPARRKDYNSSPRMRPMGAGIELLGTRKDGSEFPIDIMLAPMDTAEGRVVLSTIRDISERKQAEEALRRSEQEKRYLEEEISTGFEEIVGESSGLKHVLRQVATVAPTEATALILGETGTGKELIARAIHQLSRRSARTFVRLNCAAIPSGLLESELFGHEKGAFTGAIMQKIGRLELAHQGTLFLDEVGDIPLEIQPKLLRALQEREFERLGSTRTIKVDVHLIAATNRDLEKMVAENQFRRDLYYRLMERAVILTSGPVLRAPPAELKDSSEPMPSAGGTLEATERGHILRILKETKGVIGGAEGAATRLGLKRTTLNSKMKKLGIEREEYT